MNRFFQYLCRACCIRYPSMGWVYKSVKYINCNGKSLKVEAVGTSTISHEDAVAQANLLVDEKIAQLQETVCAPPPVTYTSTQQASASCDNPLCGEDTLAEASATSEISQEDADQKAYDAALALAEDQLVCLPQLQPPNTIEIATPVFNDRAVIRWNLPVNCPAGVHFIAHQNFGTDGNPDQEAEGNITETQEFQFDYLSGTEIQIEIWSVGDESNCESDHFFHTFNIGPEGQPSENYVSVKSYTAECPFGTVGDSVTKTVTAFSTVSQEAADIDAENQAQELAELELSCTAVPVYTSTKTAEAFCTAPAVGDTSAATETRSSTVSQEDADSLALAAATASANAGLVCELPVYESTQCITKDCMGSSTGVSVTECATRTSTVSQSDADTLASTAAEAAANASLICTWEGNAIYTAHCPDGTFGEDVTRTGHAYSTVSQDAANADALAVAQAAAESALDCHDVEVFCDTQTYTAECPEGFNGPSVTRYYRYCSEISAEDATTQALATAQALAEADLVCEED